MAEINTGADALQALFTGAATNGGAQASADASLGNYRSSSRALGMGVVVTNPITNIVIEHVAGYNGEGNGTLSAIDANNLKWTPPGGTQGDAVTIANGEQKVLTGGGTGEESKYIIVRRTSTASLSGTATLACSWEYNNAVALDNISSAEAAAGLDEVRCICLKNSGSIKIDNIKLWLNTFGTQAVTNNIQLSASGAGSIQGGTDCFADWPESGMAHVKTAAGVLKEIVYYSSRTSDMLTVESSGRAQLGTSAAAGASDDTVDAVAPMRVASEWGVVGAASQTTGSGLDDLTSGGTFKKQTDVTVVVKITNADTTDTFQYSMDGGTTWNGTDIDMTGSAQTLEKGVTVTFAATTGHTLADEWTIECTATATDKTSAGETSIPSLTWDSGIGEDDGLDFSLESDEQIFVWLRRTTPAGVVALASLESGICFSFDAA